MNKNSTRPSFADMPSTASSQPSHTPSQATLNRIRQFARAYVYFQQANPLGSIILN